MNATESAATWAFVTAVRNTTYGSWAIEGEEVREHFGDVDLNELAGAVYDAGDPWVLEVDVYDDVVDVTLSTHYTDEADEDDPEYEVAWQHYEILERSIGNV